jgi:hypothetical protein
MTRRKGFYVAWCNDCDFQVVTSDPEKVEEVAKSHEGQDGHFVTPRGPYYEAGGNVRWECSLCGFAAVAPEAVHEHVEETHDLVSHFVRKTTQKAAAEEISAGGDD